MREQTLYICEFCQTKYADKKEAEKCEKSHVFATNIVECIYIPYMNDHSGKPTSIRVKFSDGTQWTYSK